MSNDAPPPERNALVPTDPEQQEDGPADGLDAHGFDLADYDWVPIRRQKRPDGWTHQRQRLFIAHLADTGSVSDAAHAAGMSRGSAYELRRAPGADGFRAAWDAAIQQAMNVLLDTVTDRAINGAEDPIYDQHGQPVIMRRRYSDRLAIFLLSAHMPERFGSNRGAARDPAHGARPAPVLPVADALAALGPVPPAHPEKLMSPDALESALQVADIMDGQLPHWLRDTDLDPRPPEPAPPPPTEDEDRGPGRGLWEPGRRGLRRTSR